jgi:hypothetical protein
MRVAALSLRVRIGDDDVEAGKKLPGLHESERVRGTALRQGDLVTKLGNIFFVVMQNKL